LSQYALEEETFDSDLALGETKRTDGRGNLGEMLHILFQVWPWKSSILSNSRVATAVGNNAGEGFDRLFLHDVLVGKEKVEEI
jgi:hypothetical protein